jgi:hypothetical protein
MSWARAAIVVALAATLSCADREPAAVHGREFDKPEAAVAALVDAAAKGNTGELAAIFGPEATDLVQSSDPVVARRGREVFTVAATQAWKLTDETADRKTLVIGHEEWPFPIPLVAASGRWHFDTAAGKEEVLARRIGRNELSVIRICRRYVDAQQAYAKQPHDGQPAGRYATAFRSDPGRQNGLYWPAKKGEPRSPLGDLVARAAASGRSVGDKPTPFHGYYFKMLSSPGGFALAAWPAEYDVTGVMTFIINQDGNLLEKDLGPETDQAAQRLTSYAPDATWSKVQ